MALIKTLQEIKDVLPKLVSSLSNTSLLPNFERAEYKYIVPLIGPALYATLTTNYDDATLDADETILVKKLRLIIAAYAYKDELGLYNLTIGDTGARKITQGGSDRVYGWEYQELKNSLINSAMDGTEILLNYLFDNAGLFPEWTASEQYKKIAGLLIRTGTDFNDNYTLFQPQRTYFIMRSVMNDVQELYLAETIGKDLLIYLRDKVTPTADEKEGIRLLKKSLAFTTVLQSCKHYSVSFTDGGFTILGEKNNPADQTSNQPVDLPLLEMKMHECERQGNDFLEKARTSLVATYNSVGAVAGFKTAFDLGALKNFIQPADRTTGNENRKTYVFR